MTVLFYYQYHRLRLPTCTICNIVICLILVPINCVNIHLSEQVAGARFKVTDMNESLSSPNNRIMFFLLLHHVSLVCHGAVSESVVANHKDRINVGTNCQLVR